MSNRGAPPISAMGIEGSRDRDFVIACKVCRTWRRADNVIMAFDSVEHTRSYVCPEDQNVLAVMSWNAESGNPQINARGPWLAYGPASAVQPGGKYDDVEPS